ncbi:hypothetical protein GCM10008932_05220 [Alkalibacterium iburiense]|uniref:DUF3006 domain-containing protein n=1 Tax=Alkalibacterium iburiense TaxID=290589 RepID=A0ABN0X4U5_9LACT
MYAVLEEIENNLATLVLDTKDTPIIVPVTELPQPYQKGDVFVVEKRDQQWVVVSIDRDEKQKRLNENKSKRERLLKRSRRNESDS